MTTVTDRTITNYLREIADLTADGHEASARAAIGDLGDTLYALSLAQARYPKDTVIDGENVGGQFSPGDGAGGGGGGSSSGDGGDGGGAPAGGSDFTKITESVKNLDKALGDAAEASVTKAKSLVADTLAAGGAGIAAVGAYVGEKSGDSFESMSNTLDDLEAKAGEAVDAIKAEKAKVTTSVKGLIEKAKNTQVSLKIEVGTPPAPDAPEPPEEWLEALGKKMNNWVAAKAGDAAAEGKKAIKAAQDFQNGVKEYGDQVVAHVEGKADEVLAKADQLVDVGKAKVGDTADSVASWADSVKAKANGLKDQVATMISENASDIGDAYVQDVETMLTAVDDAMAKAEGVIDKAKTDVAAAGEAAQQLKTDIQNLPQTVKSGVKGAIDSTKAKAKAAVDNAKTVAAETKEIVAKEFGDAALRGEVKNLVDAVAKDVKATTEDAAALVQASAKLAKLTAQATMSSYWAAMKGIPLAKSETQQKVMAQIEKLRTNPELSDAVDRAAATSKKAYSYMKEAGQGVKKVGQAVLDAQSERANQLNATTTATDA